jgi:hypothetical protein
VPIVPHQVSVLLAVSGVAADEICPGADFEFYSKGFLPCEVIKLYTCKL